MDIDKVKQHIENLERHRMLYTPFKYIDKYVTSTTDLYNERSLLKSVAFDDDSIQYIVDLIIKDLKADTRFRRTECLYILRSIIRNRTSTESFGPRLVSSMFYLYKNFILSNSMEVQRTVAALIEDQPLDDSDLEWLIDHYTESEHHVNLLIRYPFQATIITEWARRILEKGKLKDRYPELAGLMIDDDLFLSLDQRTMMWAIFYSKCSKAKKKKLILKYMDYDDYTSALEVAAKLGIGKVSNELHKHYCNFLTEREKELIN